MGRLKRLQSHGKGSLAWSCQFWGWGHMWLWLTLLLSVLDKSALDYLKLLLNIQHIIGQLIDTIKTSKETVHGGQQAIKVLLDLMAVREGGRL